MKYVVYILESQLDGTFYIGYTSDLEIRLSQHNSGKTKYTSKKIPWKVVYTEEFNIKSEALKRERFLKNQRNRDFYFKLIKKN